MSGHTEPLTPAEIERLLDEGCLVAVYQPCYDLRTGALVAVEALARLEDTTTGGLIAPDRFLGVAERSGLVSRIDAMMFEQATRQLARWRAHPAGQGLCVAINLSTADLEDQLLPDRVAATADEAGVPPDALILELTETLLSGTGRGHERLLARLSELGCNVTLDDFGTGNASFAYLQRFQVQGIKLDRSFVQQLGTGSPNERLVESLVRFCLSLGVHVVAEGIEDERQVEVLRRLGCPFGQGFLMSRPLTAEQVDRLLASGDSSCAVLRPRPVDTPSPRVLEDPPPAPSRPHLDRLVSRVLAGLIAAIIVGVAVFALFGVERSEASLDQAAQGRLGAVDALAAGQVDSELGGLRDVVTTYSRSEAVERAIRTRKPALMAAALTTLRSARSGIFTTSLYDASGTLLEVDPPAPGVVGRNFAFREWYARSRGMQAAYVSPAFQLARPGAPWALAVAAAVRDETGRPVGFVLATLELSRLQQELRDMLAQHGISATLVDSRGTVLAAPLDRVVGETATDARLAERAADGSAGAEVQWAVRPVRAIDGRLLAEQSRTAALGSSGGRAWPGSALLLLLAGAALVLVLLWLLADRRRRRLETELNEAHDWVTSILRSTPAPFAVCDAEDRIQVANPAFAALLGVSTDELPGQRLGSWLPTRDLPEGEGGGYQASLVTTEGEVRRVEVRTQLLGDPTGQPMRLHALVDVTPHRREQDRLRAQGRTDALTGAGNRVALREALAMAARTGDGLNAVVMMDLDGFKAVNDSLGHAVGDDLLCTVADVLRAAVHPGDLVARVGGDEFVAVVRIDEGLDGGDVAAQLGERVRSALRAHPSSARVDVGVSLGVVTIGRESSDTDELLRIADERMYDAKRRTRRAGR